MTPKKSRSVSDRLKTAAQAVVELVSKIGFQYARFQMSDWIQLALEWIGKGLELF